MDDRKHEQQVRNGTLPLITTSNRKIKRRVWANSEKLPWFPLDGFRVLKNQTVLAWKKKWWIVGEWTTLYNKSDYDEVAIIDEAIIR